MSEFIAGELTKDGDLRISGDINTRLPVITDGLVAHYPMDETLNKIRSLAGIKVLGHYQSTHYWYNWLISQGATITNSTDLTTVDVATALQYDLIICDYYVWGFSIMDKLKQFVDACVSVIAQGNDTRTNVFVKTYTATAHATHDILIEPNIPIYTDSLMYPSAGIADLYGGIDQLQNGAIPFYRRSDTNQITGYIYESFSGAVLFFDQEGDSNVLSFHKEAILYTLGKSKGNITNSNTTLTYDGIAVEEATINQIVISNMESYAIGYTGNVCGFGNNWSERFGIGNYKVEIVPVYDSPVPGLTKAQGIETYGGGWGGWVAGNIGNTSGSISYSIWIKLHYGQIEWGDLNNPSYKITMNSSNTPLGKWVYITKASTGTSGGRHLYASGVTKADIMAVQIENKAFSTSYVNGSRGDGTFGISTQLSSNSTIAFDYYLEGDGISETVISNAQYNSKWWGIYLNSNGQFYMHEGSGGLSVTSSPAYIPQKNKWINIAISWDNTTQFFYADGVLLGTLATVGSANSSNVPIIYLGWGWNRSNAIFKNLSIYNRALSESEAKELVNPSFQFTPTGNLIASQVVTEPNEIPSDAKYFSLGCDSKDKYKLISPSTEANTVYEDGSVWVGNATTNIYASPQSELTNINVVDANGTLSWAEYTTRYNRSKIAKVTKIAGTPSTHASFRDCRTCLANTYYTLSFKIKMLSGGTVSERIRAHFGGGTGGSLVYQVLSDGWYLCYTVGQIVGTTLCAGVGFIGDGALECLVTEMQLEQRSFPTPFANGTRSAGSIKWPLTLSDNATFLFWRKSLQPNSAYDATQTTYPNMFEIGNYYSNASFTLWNFGPSNSGTNICAYVKNNVDSGWTYGGGAMTPYTGEADRMKWHMHAIVLSGSSGTINSFHVFKDETKSNVITINGGITSWNGSFFGMGSFGGMYPNSYYKDLIYVPRALTDDEIKAIYQTKMDEKSKLQVQGSIMTGQVIT